MRVVALAVLLTGCATPIGLYQHEPEPLWSEPLSTAMPDVGKCGASDVVFKRLVDKARVPAGGHYVTAEPDPGALTTTYALDGSPALPLFHAVVARLRGEGCPVWADYQQSPQPVRRPPGAAQARVVVGRLDRFELSTFVGPDGVIHEAGRVVLHVEQGEKATTVDVRVRVTRREGDVLEALAWKVAAGLAAWLRGGGA